MRTHTSEFKEELKVFGRQIQGKIVYYPSYELITEDSNNILTEADLQIISEQANYEEATEINAEDIFSISIIKNGDLLQSLMKEFDFETKEELNIGSVVNPQFGLLVNEEYEYLDYGNYIINSKEFNMDTETWSYVCYDKMLFSMIKYRGLSNVQYPITIKQFINKLCDKVGLEFEDSEFVNQGQLIYEDLYKNRDVTYRDIFDEISKIVAGNLLINDNDKLEVGYVNDLTTQLPSEYTQVDYIEGHRAEYIDTGFKATPKTRVEATFQFTQVTPVQQRIFGNDYSETDGLVFTTYINGGGNFAWACQNNIGNWQNTGITADTNKHTFIIDSLNKVVTMDDRYNTTITTTRTNNSINTMLLFAYRYNNVVDTNSKSYLKMYSTKIYDNNVLVRDFIPCYRNSDNVVGMYDLVNNVFYTNQGTGAFTYGQAISDTINEDYLKDTNVRMSEKIGVINSVAILDSDNDLQYIAEDTQSIKENEMTRITITDNLIAMNGETQEIANNILNKLNGLYYYANDLQTTGVCYYDFLDMFNVEARGNTYQCLLLNNEITITQGIEEHIFTEKFEEIETNKAEYTTSVLTNKQASLKIDTQEAKIEARVEKDGVISAINLSPEEAQINANKISLEGKEINLTSDNIVIESNNFSVDEDGKITATAGKISDFTIDGEDGFVYKIYAPRTFTSDDVTRVRGIITGTITPTTEDLQKYDLDGSGQITSSDWTKINLYVKNNITETNFGKFEVSIPQPTLLATAHTGYINGDNNLVSGFNFANAIFPSLTINNSASFENGIYCYKQSTFVNSNDDTTILLNGDNGNITCVSLTQTSKEENKKNFEKLTNAKDILNQVDIYKYNFKDENDNVKKSIGFVIGDDFNYSKEITSTNNDGANIYSMVSVLWQVVKEQQEEIKELKEMIKYGKY